MSTFQTRCNSPGYLHSLENGCGPTNVADTRPVRTHRTIQPGTLTVSQNPENLLEGAVSVRCSFDRAVRVDDHRPDIEPAAVVGEGYAADRLAQDDAQLLQRDE